MLEKFSKASNDIAMGDIVSKSIRSSGTGSWSLLPVQGMFSVVRPGRILRGSLPGGPGGVSFPAWFGKNSTYGRLSRINAEVASHLRLSTHTGSTNSRSLVLDYMTAMAELFTRPLKEGQVFYFVYIYKIFPMVIIFKFNGVCLIVTIRLS